ncbi:putative reverse transcriptase domain-containing protein [Tanacetum coccineum]
MSDSEDSTVTYTTVSSPFEDLSDIGSLGFDGLPMMLEDPYWWRFIPSEDEVFPAEEQPLHAVVSPTTDSPGYIVDSNPEEDPEEDPTDYPDDGGDDIDDDDESSDDDAMRLVDDDFEEDDEITRLIAIPSPPPSPLPQIPSPPLLVSSRATVSPSTNYCQLLLLRWDSELIGSVQALSPSTYILAFDQKTPPLTTYTVNCNTYWPPLQGSTLLLNLERTGSRFELTPPQKRLCIALGPKYKVDESSSAPTARPSRGFRADYGFVATLDYEIRRDPERYVGYGDDRLLMSGRLTERNLEDRACSCSYWPYLMVDWREARLSREAWGRSMDANDNARFEVRALRTTVLAQQIEIAAIGDVEVVCGGDEARQHLGSKEEMWLHLGPRDGGSSIVSCLRRYYIFLWLKKMAPKRTTRANPAATTAITSVTNAQLKAMIDQGVTDALAALDADRNTNGDDIHNSWKGGSSFKKLEAELWNLKVKGTDVIGYNQCFQELALLCVRIFPEELDKIERYVGGLPDMIHGSIENQKKGNDDIQQPNKSCHNRAYTAGSGEKKPYGGSEPLSTANANASNNQRGIGAGQKPTCYECGAQVHFKRDCPKLKNNNRGNQGRNGNASAKVYAVGRARTNPDSNIVTGTFLLNNRYASVLFDTCADRSFVSTAFRSQIDITPSTLDHYYDVELADGRIIGLNVIIRGCTLNFLNHPFNIDLMPVELGSLDVIIGRDWLAKYQAVIVCAEKIVRIPWGNETLIVRGDGSDRGNETRLKIISCTKMQKYMLKGCPIFLAHVTTKETEDKSEKK